MRQLSRAVPILVLLAILPGSALAQSIYGVSIDTRRIHGSSGKLVFDITTNTPLTNRFDVVNFSTDGTIGLPETQGELVAGDLIQNVRPAKFTRIKANTFFTELVLPFTAFGDEISFTLNLSETAALDQRPPDQLSLYLLDSEGRTMAGNGVSGDPNIVITVTGQRGGRLQVFDRSKDTGRSEAEDMMAPNRPQEPVRISVTPAWTPDDPTLFQNATAFVGTLQEFCNRRCAGEAVCTGGAFGLSIDDNTFYAFDDVSNLKAQVALVGNGENPLKEGQFGRAKVVGILSNSVLTIRDIVLYQ